MKMRSLVVTEPGVVEWHEASAPRLQNDREAIVTPIAASRCDYDRELVRGASRRPTPFPIGHEAVARVVEIGDGVRTVRPGDVVVVVWHICCGECGRCRAGLTAHCERVPPFSAYGGGAWGGLFDDLVRVPFADAMLTPVPSGINTLDAAVAGDSLGLGHAIMSRNLDRRTGRVAIFGRGEHGLYQVAFARDLGFSAIHYVDESDERRALAQSLGAHVSTAFPPRAQTPFDLIVDAAGNSDWLHRSIGVLAPEGVIECLGGYFDDIRVPGMFSYINGATIRFGCGNNGRHVQAALDALSRDVVRPAELWSTAVDWDELPAAYTDEHRKLISLRPDSAEGPEQLRP